MTVLVGPDVHQHDFFREQGIGFGEELPGTDMTQNRTVSPDIIVLDGHAAGQNQTHPVSLISGVKNDRVLRIRFFLRMQRSQAVRKFFRRYAPEKDVVF